jgi:hypothetical protein
MALKELLVDLEDFSVDLAKFYKQNPFLAAYPGKSGPVEFLKTGFDQRSIPFGNDLPGGGSSNQPFIKKNLPPVLSDPITDWPDFLVRDPKSFFTTRTEDVERIGKFLLSPKGLLFTAKQELLSLQNPIVPGRPNRSTPVAGLYFPYMTLGQVAVEGTGLHIEKQGASPIFNQNSKYEYQYTNNNNGDETNRLTILYNSKVLGISSASNTLQAKRLGIASLNEQLLSYIGGPNVSVNGKTTIQRAGNAVYSGESFKKRDDNFALSQARVIDPNKFKKVTVNGKVGYNKFLGVSNTGFQRNYFTNESLLGLSPILITEKNQSWIQANNSITPEGDLNLNNSSLSNSKTTKLGVYTFTQPQLIGQTPISSGGDTSFVAIKDFRKKIRESNATANDKIVQDQQGLIYTDYENFNRETRVGLGNPGKRTRNRGKLNSYDNDTVDRINMLPLYVDRAVLDPFNLTRDLVKFRFEVINNTAPGESTFIHFRAFLGQITDNFKSEWGATKYVGRGENFYNYNGFSRDISFTFKVHAQSRAEMKSLYQKLNYLASSLAPDYTGGYMKGNLIRLTIGDYLYVVPGFISSLSYTIPEDAPWEIALNQPESGDDTGVMETPKLFDVSVNFTPIHDFVPELGATRKTAFITNPTGTGGKNQYLDDSKIYFFNNQTNPVSNPQNTVLYNQEGVNTRVASNGLSTITAANLEPYATKTSPPDVSGLPATSLQGTSIPTLPALKMPNPIDTPPQPDFTFSNRNRLRTLSELPIEPPIN